MTTTAEPDASNQGTSDLKPQANSFDDTRCGDDVAEGTGPIG